MVYGDDQRLDQLSNTASYLASSQAHLIDNLNNVKTWMSTAYNSQSDPSTSNQSAAGPSNTSQLPA